MWSANSATRLIPKWKKYHPIPISARQLEAIVRLTEASAKVRLSDYATVEDAKRAIDLMMSYLGDVGVDSSTGQLGS